MEITSNYNISTTGIREDDKANYAYFRLYLGNQIVRSVDDLNARATGSNKPNIYQSVEVTKLADAGTTMQMVLFDDAWDRIETLLMNSPMHVKFEYGYRGGEMSPLYDMVMTNYTVDIKPTGVILHIEAISTDAYRNLEAINSEPLGNNPTEAIKKICRILGFSVDDEDFVATEDCATEFSLQTDNPFTYMRDEIVPYARTVLVGDPNNPEIPAGENVAFWVDGDENHSAHLGLKHPLVVGTGTEKTYIYSKGYNSVVSNISFSMKGVFAGTTDTQTGTKTSSSMIDFNTKEEIVLESDVDIKGDEGHSKAIQKSQSSVSIDVMHKSPEDIDKFLKYSTINALDSAAVCTLTILGDPEIQMLDYITLLILKDDGTRYHLSGVYQVQGIIDTVENGQYLTTLKLFHAGWFSSEAEYEIMNRAYQEAVGDMGAELSDSILAGGPYDK